MTKKMFLSTLKWGLPLILLIVLGLITPHLDLPLSSLFYTPSPTGGKGHFFDDEMTRFLFQYGEDVGLAVWGLSVLILFVSFFYDRLKKWKPALLVMILTLVLGAGITINLGLKKVWGRPRPKQTVEFAGRYDYRPFYKPDFHTIEPQKSFPSGHAAMGFYYVTLCFIGKRYHNRKLFWSGVVLSVVVGLSLSFTRIVQGGHYLSDVLFSGIVMWYAAAFSDWLVYSRFKSK